MIDVHSHIVFEVDDGSKSIEQSLQILHEARKVGFDTVIVTPHYIEGYYEYNKNQIAERINKLQSMQDEVKILQGNEIYITENINELLEEEEASTLVDSKYVLFELPLNAEPLNLMSVVYSILEKGRIPVLAHPERYPHVQKDPNTLIELIESGVIMQSNYGSILGQYGKECKKTVQKMLKHNMVHLLGSDVHRPRTVYYNMPEILKTLEKLIGRNKLEYLTTINPSKMINNENIEVETPEYIKKGLFAH